MPLFPERGKKGSHSKEGAGATHIYICIYSQFASSERTCELELAEDEFAVAEAKVQKALLTYFPIRKRACNIAPIEERPLVGEAAG